MKIDNQLESFEVFPWHDNFNTEISIIDEQHKELVAILNTLASQLAQKADSKLIDQVFDQLTNYTRYHFETEETIWESYFLADPVFSSHQKLHKSFIKRLIKLKNDRHKKPLDEVVNDVIKYLTHWLAFHILDTDRRMALTIDGIKSGMPMEQAKAHATDTMSYSIDILIDTVLMMYETLATRTMKLMQEHFARQRIEVKLNINEKRWGFLVGSSRDHIWEWNIANDDSYQLEDSPPMQYLFHSTRNSAKQATKIHPADQQQVKQEFQSHIDGKTDFFFTQHRVVTKDNVCYWVLTQGKIISRDANNQPTHIVGTHTNTTEREIANLLYQNSSEGMMVTDANNKIININPAFTKILGFEPIDVIGKTPKTIASGKHNKQFYNKMWNCINDTGEWRGEIWDRKKNGTIFPGWLIINSVYNPDKSVHYRIGLFTDITEKKINEDAIWKQANFDALTNLPNRQLFHKQFKQSLKTAHQKQLALLFIDLDNFKEINDSLGHSYGDDLLAKAAKRLKGCIRESDTIARLSGDEFTVILNGFDNIKAVERITQEMLNTLQKPFSIKKEVSYISASIGITLYPKDGITKEKLLQNADQAMYRAKSNGRNCYTFFTQSLQDTAKKKMLIANELRNALKSKPFELYYQPIVDLATGNIQKAEALIRWNNPDRGLILPDEFIPIAESTGIIHELGNWVFYEAVKQVAKWQKSLHPQFQICINKSPVQFMVNSMQHRNWFSYIDKHGVSGQSIIIEITESLLLDTNDIVNKQLSELNHAKFQISLDDFGTGFSSLAYLQKLDIDFIKIDKSFIQNLTPLSKNLVLCQAMIIMAHALNIKVIAEGIETEEQKNLLTDLGCNYGQGYFFSTPITAFDFEMLYSKVNSS